MTREVVGYEGLYFVDEYGDITNAKTGRIMKRHINRFGYANVSLTKNGKQSQHKVHRIVAEAFIANPEGKKTVNHIDGNKLNNYVGNLEWATYKENNVHASNMGLMGTAKRVKIVETNEIFNSVGSCARKIGGDTADIMRCLHGKTKTHKGYHFAEVSA